MTVSPDEWADITEELTLDCAQLKLGQLVHEPAFSLHEAMTAIEIMHPQAANVYDDEEFQPDMGYGFNLAAEKNITGIVKFLNDSSSDAARLAKKANLKEDIDGWNGVSSDMKIDTDKLSQLISSTLKLISAAFPRDVPIVPPDDVYLKLAPILEEFRHLLKMFNFTAYEQFLDFTRSFSDKSPSLIARSLLFVIFIPSNRKILGKLMMANVIESSICSYLKLDLSKEFRSNRNVQFWTSTYGCSIFCNLIQDYCFNKARQRERIEFELETIGRLIDEVDRAVNEPDIKTTTVEQIYLNWIVLQASLIMEVYLTQGFSLGLYANYELEYINFYLGDVIYPSILRCLSSFQSLNQNIRKGKKIKSDTISERLQLYGIQSHLSRATFFSIRGFLKKNLMETPQIISDSVGDKQNTRYTHRFAALMHVRIPTFVSWGDYRRISGDLDKRVDQGIFNDLAEGSRIFESVKNQVNSQGLQGPFFNHIKKVTTANMITTKLLSTMDVQKKLIFEKEESVSIYPTFKLV
ncbi:Oidioi.mRNA.OKI2018_I69.chr1.g2751.t1.cds [Oikopleura dioica]|uniref:N-alpha-acetyltransferase 35, NatC auxiliary subunit n=2 Tax=Oikopleura dioica TaxID=34765 RepID=A0ABN7STT2_OIKDI|nr:Oidioi.mRNA.OKI2018_I69.chr1.g2751.t1.cds [Oikopleura dioica]